MQLIIVQLGVPARLCPISLVVCGIAGGLPPPGRNHVRLHDSSNHLTGNAAAHFLDFAINQLN